MSEPNAPRAELAPVGPHAKDRNRDARGRYVKRNNGALTHGAQSEQRSLMLAPVRESERAQILTGLGLSEADVTRPMSYAIERLIEAHLIAQSYIEFLAASGGVITTKGRQRRAVDGWVKAADRVAKFAAMIGLERRTREATMSTRDWLLSERAGMSTGRMAVLLPWPPRTAPTRQMRPRTTARNQQGVPPWH